MRLTRALMVAIALALLAPATAAAGTFAVQGHSVNLTASTGLISNAAVVTAVKSYIDGYRGCMQPYSYLTVAVGTGL